MKHCLKVRLDREADGTARITADVRSGSFSGKGEAWFDLSQIMSFAKQLEAFAKSLNNPPMLEGGYLE